ncbi:EpsG family protein [Vibrio fluvialis]|uniref:EpsG family protein n=1 Tax=Vibrio fluvialis TaxID=676 RepID=UPI00398C5590
MYIYFLLPIISFILIPLNNRYVKFSVFVIGFGLFCGLRSSTVDLDYLNYYYLWFRGYNFIEFFVEPIPKLIFSTIYNLGLEFNYSLIIFSVLTLYLIFRSCVDKKINVAIFFVTYSGYFLLVQNMMQIRIGLALAFFLYAVLKWEANKKVGAVLLIASVLCHQSLLLLVLLFFLLYFYSSKMTILYYFFGSALIFQAQSVLGFDYLEVFFKYIVEIADHEKLSRYYQFYVTSENKVNVFNVLHLLNLFLYFSCICVVVSSKVTERYILFFINLMSIGIILFNIFYRLPTFSFRMSEMMFFFLPVVLAFLYGKFNWISKVLFSFVILFISLFSIYKVVIEGSAISDYSVF